MKGDKLFGGGRKFFGVFGKNGAGKSTLFKNMLGLIRPTEGEILYKGKDIKKNNSISIGYLPENISIYRHMNVEENLKVAALSAGNQLTKIEIEEILDRVNLTGAEKTLGRNLSLGMTRRLQFAMATMTKPIDVLILDEPTNGMDINGVIWLKDYLVKLKQKKITVLVCSHSLNIMEDLIDEYCIIKDGKIVQRDKWNKNSRNKYRLILKETIDSKDLKNMSDLGEVLKAENDYIEIVSNKKLLDFVELIKQADLNIEDIEMERIGLEEIFVESVKDDA